MERNRTRNVCLLLACLIAAGASAQSASDDHDAPTRQPASAPASVPAERVVSGWAPTFTLRVPAEFEPMTPVGNGVAHTLIKGRDESRIVLNLIPFATEFRKEPLDEKTLEVPVERRYELTWSGADGPASQPDATVVVYEIAQFVDGRDVVVLNAAVPTAGNGLIVQLAGPRAVLGEMEQLLPTLLSGLDAPRPEKKSRSFDARSATMLMVVGMLVIIFTLRRHQTMRKRQEQADESRRRAAWGDKPPE